jgi:hypothetical protein
MRRSVIGACILAMLSVVAPAEAGGLERGSVRVPVANPAVPNAAWDAKVRANGETGWIFPLNPSADDAEYTLVTTGGLTGVENLDAYFYEDAPDGSGPGRICRVAPREQGIHSETGVMCPGPQVAAWGIVVLTTGANATFTLTW